MGWGACIPLLLDAGNGLLVFGYMKWFAMVASAMVAVCNKSVTVESVRLTVESVSTLIGQLANSEHSPTRKTQVIA